MWCPQCESDVAAEVSADDHRARCAVCGNIVQSGSSSPLEQRTRHALQLLERWSRTNVAEMDDVPDPVVATSPKPVSAPKAAPSPDSIPMLGEPPSVEATSLESHDRPGGLAEAFPETRTVEAAESVPEPARAASDDVPPRQSEPDVHRSARRRSAVASRPRPKPVVQRIDAPHAGPPEPHREPRKVTPTSDGLTNWMAVAGQLLAYLGVAVLTVGTMLVLWGHFGGRTEFTPSGWLTAAAGQMLLFLGVVTLVSTGIEQSTDEFRRHSQRTSDRLSRLETLVERQVELVESDGEDRWDRRAA